QIMLILHGIGKLLYLQVHNTTAADSIAGKFQSSLLWGCHLELTLFTVACLKHISHSDEETASWVSTDSRSRTLLSMVVILVDGSKMETALRQGEHVRTQLTRDIIVGYGNWEFDPTELSNPFSDSNKGSPLSKPLVLNEDYEKKRIKLHNVGML
ncbi:hypothetical protein HID58_069046, partial [Brassica napus]